MKSIFICLASLIVVAEAQAQFDINKPLKLSVPIKPNSPSLPAPKKFTFDAPKLYSPKFPDLNAPKPRSVDLVQKNDFVNPNDVRLNKLNKGRGNFLGDFQTNSMFVRIVYRDFGSFDGDEVSILKNKAIIVSKVVLEPTDKEVKIDLSTGFNQIQFLALNEGLEPTNTAEFDMYDDKGNLITSQQWNLFIGERATIVITKE